MKKSIKLASALLLLNTSLLTPITTVVNAQNVTQKTEVTTDPGSTDPGTTDPGTTDPGSTDPGTTDPGSTDPGTTDPGSTDPGTTDPGSTDPGTTDPGTTDPGSTDPGSTDPGTTDKDELKQAKQQLQNLINEAKIYLDYSKYSNDFLFYLENYIINAEVALADPNSTIDDIQDHIEVLTTAISYAKDPVNAREQNTDVTIDATDKTMYVGDVITPEMVLGWATLNNADGLYLEAEVVGNPIMINTLDSTLVKSGTYTIRYTVKSTDPEGNPLNSKISPKMSVISKDITLTVLDKGTDPIPSEPIDPVAPINPTTPKDTNNTLIQPKVTNVSEYIQKKVNKDTSKLPETGESESSSLVLLGAMLVLSGTYIFNKKRYNNDLEL